MNKIKIDRCPYCGNNEFVIGYQQGYGAMMKDDSGLNGSKTESTICINCGSIVHTTVLNPEKLLTKKFDE